MIQELLDSLIQILTLVIQLNTILKKDQLLEQLKINQENYVILQEVITLVELDKLCMLKDI